MILLSLELSQQRGSADFTETQSQETWVAPLLRLQNVSQSADSRARGFLFSQDFTLRRQLPWQDWPPRQNYQELSGK